MKAISLWQPWATLIQIGAKKIETRCWNTSYRGPLAIHAAKKWNNDLFETAHREPFHHALTRADLWGKRLPLGKIVCICNLVAIYETTGKTYFPESRFANQIPPAEPELSFGDYRPGRYCWILQDIQPIEAPIPFSGKRRFFDVPDELIARHLSGRAA